MNSKDKIQCLLINHLLKEGEIELCLPSGMVVALGITKDTKHGIKKVDDYCWLTASQDDEEVSFGPYNLELQFSRDRLVFEGAEADHTMIEVI